MCILVASGHVGHQVLCKVKNLGRYQMFQKNANFLLVLVQYIPGQFDPGILGTRLILG